MKITSTQQAAIKAMDDMCKAGLKVVTLNAGMYKEVVRTRKDGSLELADFGVHRANKGFKYKELNIVCRKRIEVQGNY